MTAATTTKSPFLSLLIEKEDYKHIHRKLPIMLHAGIQIRHCADGMVYLLFPYGTKGTCDTHIEMGTNSKSERSLYHTPSGIKIETYKITVGETVSYYIRVTR